MSSSIHSLSSTTGAMPFPSPLRFADAPPFETASAGQRRRLLPPICAGLRIGDGGAVNPTDQVLMAKHLLEATLTGAVLFLALMIDRLHHYIRELRIRRKSMEAVKKQMRGSEDAKAGNSEEIKTMEEEAAKLRGEVKCLESELQ